MLLSTQSQSDLSTLSDNNEEETVESLSSSSSNLSSENSSDSEQQQHTASPTSKRRQFALRMVNFSREMAIMLLVAAAYAALTNETPPKISKSPAAYPFFVHPDELVKDWYRGEISQAIDQARTVDIAFVMFYAPWNAESQSARREFRLAAELMHEFVSFSSVNCWQPGSECKKQYGKVYKWPVLIAYPTHGRGIQYNGPILAAHMVKFLQNMCKPFAFAASVGEALHGHDVAVVANLDVAPKSKFFSVFYSTALRYLEFDYLRDVNFAVLPRKQNGQHLFIYNWNETIVFNGINWDVEEITGWISRNLRVKTPWINLSETKSMTLSQHIQRGKDGATVLLFTPRNPLALFSNDFYDLFRQVSYEYGKCDKTGRNNSMVDMRLALMKMERKKNWWRYLKLSKTCRYQLRNGKQFDSTKLWLSNTKIWNNLTSANCDCLKQRESNENVHGSNECERFLLAEKYAPHLFEDRQNESSHQIDCTKYSNHTLNFITLDSLRHYHFAEKLGLDVRKVRNKSGVIIVNEQEEVHYLMSKTINEANIKEFIGNYTNRLSERSLASITTIKKQWKKKQNGIVTFGVKELTSGDFLPTIFQPNKIVIVFYYSKQCAFCSGISHAYLTAAKLLTINSADEVIEFARIDGDLNLLPWEYTMESYPTILLFPAKRKDESRAMPLSIPITVPNIINFILTNVEREDKVRFMWRICLKSKFQEEQRQCLHSVNTEMLTIIEKTLKLWRLVDLRRKQQVLRKLQVLRQLHLLLAHNWHAEKDILKLFQRFNDNNVSNKTATLLTKDEL